MKKKGFNFKIASLALCALTSLGLAVATLNQPAKTVSAATVTQVGDMHTLSGFTIEETAAIRNTEPNGIRFTTKVSESMKATIVSELGGDETKIAWGTLLLPTDFLGDAELTHKTPSVVEGIATQWFASENGEKYTVVLGGKGGASLGESYYNRPISARSFAVNTETGVVYYTENTASRSIGYVAYMAKNDPEKPDTRPLVADIEVKTTKELVFNENVSIHNEESDGAGIVVNKYEQQSADVFVLKIGGIVVDTGITYTSSATDVITVEDGKITAVGNGVSTVKGTVTYNNVEYTASKEISTDYYVPSSQYTILVPANANEYETTAANKLQDMILEATGVELAILTESGTETTDGKYLSVGDTVLATENCAVSDLTRDTASRVKTVGNSVFVRGKTKAATLYGVQRLLKETVGYEYYLDNTYVVEETKEIVLADKDYTPAIDEVWQVGGSADSVVVEEHAAVAYTANLIPIGTTDEEDATNLRYKGAAHNSILFFSDGVDDSSLYSLSSKSYRKWYATNSSNYYLTNKSGIASTFSGAGKVELCYTAHGDSSVRSAMIEKLTTEMFRKMTTIEEFKNYDRVAFSHADMQSWCECSNCNNEGNPSDNMLHFILDVAASLKTKLADAGDARAETFKITTLFYNETNLYPANIANYQSAVDNYMQHVEIWFAETRADYHVPLYKETNNTTWNTTAYNNFKQWTELASSKGADVLWWGYYGNTKSAFIPYDSIDALRANYDLAYNAGVDYMFNQMLQYTANWARLKQYLMSELRWNATPDDATWNGWIADYMTGAFGPGATAMTEYYDAWKTWATDNASDFNNTSGYGGSGISKLLSEVATTSDTTAETLESWIEACNKAIAALDVNDDNYEIYYNNIALERMTPLYLIMHLYGFDYEISTSDNPYEAITSYSLKNSAYVLPYAQDFLDAATTWNVYQDGEMSNLDLFKETLTSQLSGITAYEETAKQTVVTGTSITLTSANIASGESYTATLINSAGEVAATEATAADGSVTLTFDAAPAVGASNVVLRSSSKAITFTNVLVVTGTIANYTELKAITGKTLDGYYVLTNDITDATGTITLRAGTFSGILDGNGYTVDSVSVGASGLFRVLSGATIKNINFTNFTATAPAFGTSATNSTFENVTISFKSGGPTLATTEETCTYTNVTVYAPSASATSMPEGVKVIVGADTGKTFYIPEGETTVWLRDENLVNGNYTVDVNGNVSNASVFAEGKLQVAIDGLALGDTVKVSCDNGTSAYVYNVMRVSKIVMSESGEQLPVYNCDKKARGYYHSDVVQYVTVEDTSTDGNGGWGDGVWDNRVKIFAPGTQDYITVDFVAESDFVGSMFQIWPSAGSCALSKAGACTISQTIYEEDGITVKETIIRDDIKVSIVDEYGFKVNSVTAGKRYTLRVCDSGAEGLAIGVYGANTIYFGNVTYGKGTPAEAITPPVNLNDGSCPIYKGDETALGFAEDTTVYEYVGVENGDYVAIKVDSTNYDYVDVQFVITSGEGYFFMHGLSGGSYHNNGASYVIDPSWIRIADGNNSDSDRTIEIYDASGNKVTSLMANNVLYTLRVFTKVGELDEIRLSKSGSTIYLANITQGLEADLPEPEVEGPIKQGDGSTALPNYKDDVTAIGFAESTYVQYMTTETLTGEWWDGTVDSNGKTREQLAARIYGEAGKYVTVKFATSEDIASGSVFYVWGLLGSTNTVNGGLNFTTTTYGKILDVDGYPVSSISKNTVYVLELYMEGTDTYKVANICTTGMELYFDANSVTCADASMALPLPENVVMDATEATLPNYTGDKSAYGFANTDYVFEATMTADWDDRVIIPVDSTNYDYMDVEFVVTSGLWYFNAWVVNAGGMLDGSYLVAENASNATYGSGYAPHTANTGANGGLTKIQVLDTDGNVVTGGRTVGTRYVLRVYLDEESLTNVQLGQANTTILFANVTFGIVETVTAGGTNTNAVSVYDGDVTALGFASGSRVYEYVGTDASKDKAAFEVDATYDYVDVQFVIGSGDGYFFGYALKSGSFLNSGSSYVIDPSNLRIASGATMDRTIQVFNANGNAVSTLLNTNTLYTLRVYTSGMDQFMIAKAGSTIYLANVTFGNDAAAEKPTEVVKDGSGTELAQYTGNNASIGFADDDYVFEQVTTDSWSHRAHIGNNSTADFLVFDFSITNPSNMTIWFTRNGSVVAGYSNIVTPTTYVAANECAARTIYVFGADGSGVSEIVANTKYTMWVYLGGADTFHGIAVGNSNATIYYANVRYEYTGENIMRQGDANALLPEYDGDETALGFKEGTFVQTLVGESDSWVESIYANRARITADGSQDYIAVDFAVANAISGSNLFYLWAANNVNGAVAKDGTCSAFTVQIVDANGFAVSSLEAGKKYTFYVYDPGATYLAIGAYCNNTIYFGNVTYGTGELEEPYELLNNATTYEGDVTTLGFAEGEYVQQIVTEATDNVWDGTRQASAVDIVAPEGQYVSIMFSLNVDFTSSDGNLFFAWCRLGETWPTNFYVSLTASANARILGTNGEVVTDTLKANTVYMLELYADGVDKYQLTNINKMALTVSFATKSVKTYATSIANSPVTGSRDGAVTVHYGAEELGFDRNEVVKRLETETVSNVWSDTQATSGVGRASWLIKVASEAGKVVKIRFALSQDFTSTGMLFYVWAYSDNSGTCPAKGSVKLSGSSAMTASITDEAGNAVSELKAGQVYELSLYVETAIKYDIGNFVTDGMITYVSSEVTLTDPNA